MRLNPCKQRLGIKSQPCPPPNDTLVFALGAITRFMMVLHLKPLIPMDIGDLGISEEL